MQSTKNKLAQFNALRCEAMAKIDLLLLEERCPQHPDLPRFKFCPQRNSDDILFSLLDYATEEEILTRRTADENILNSDVTSVDGEGGQIQGGGAPNPDGASGDGEGGQTQDGGTPNLDDTPANGEGGQIQGGGAPNPDGASGDGEGGQTQDGGTPNLDDTPANGEGGQIQGSGAPNPDGTPGDGEQTQDNGMPNSNETSSEGEESLILEVGNQDESPAQEGTVSSVVSSLQERATKKK